MYFQNLYPPEQYDRVRTGSYSKFTTIASVQSIVSALADSGHHKDNATPRGDGPVWPLTPPGGQNPPFI